MLKQLNILNNTQQYKTYFFLNSINLINFKFLVKKFNKELKFFYILKKKNLSSLLNFFTKNLTKNLTTNFLEFKNLNYIFNFLKKKKLKIQFKFFFLNFKFEHQINFIPDSLPFCDLLKTNKIHHLNLKNIVNNFGYIYIKSSGINSFITLTNDIGNVIISYSGGIFKDVKKIKEKKSLNIIRQLGQLISYKTYKCNFKYIFLNIRLDSNKIRAILKNFYQGFIFIFKLNIYKICFKRPITRNGVKLKKLPRK